MLERHVGLVSSFVALLTETDFIVILYTRWQRCTLSLAGCPSNVCLYCMPGGGTADSLDRGLCRLEWGAVCRPGTLSRTEDSAD